MYEILVVTEEWQHDADEWMPNAKCLDKKQRDWQRANPNDQFFDERPNDENVTAAQDPEKVARAKSFCHSCPVKDACLNHALKYNESGIWGGTTERERRAMKRRTRRSALKFLEQLQAQLPDGNVPNAS